MAPNGGKIKDAAGNIGTASNLSPSLIARVAQGVKYVVTGVKDSSWFGPNQPIAPVAQEAAGRVIDYQNGYNLLQRPRQEAEAVISFGQLRQLSDACNIMRLAIETRKDQIARLAWNIKVRDVGGKPKKSENVDPRIAQVEAFFRMPDKRLDWSTWLRKLVEDLLVIDAPAIIRRKDKAGRPYAFNIADGAMFKLVIDDDGLPPLPPSPAYQQILHGQAAVDYTTDDLLYLPRNLRSHRLYGFSPVEQVVMMVNIALRRSMAQLSYFTEGNIPEALITCPPDWTPNQVQQMQEMFDDMLRGNQAERSGAKFVPGGISVQFTKDALLKDDFDEWLARIICFAFSIPPTAFVKQMNRASSQTQKESADEEGLAPLQQWVKTMMDRLLAEDFGWPDLEFSWFEDTATDPLIMMQVNTGYVAAGLKSRNEVRGELGLDPMPNGDEYTVTTGTGVVKLEDAIAPPEPPPPQLMSPNNQALGGQGNEQNAVPPKGGKQPESRQPQGKKKDLTKADDEGQPQEEDDQQTDDSDEEKLVAILALALRQQGDVLAAKVAGSEHTVADAGDVLESAIDAGALDMDRVHASVSAILQRSAVDAAHSELLLLPAPAPKPEGSEAGESTASRGGEAVVSEPQVPAAAATANTDLTVAISNRNITSLVNKDAVEFASSRSAEMIGKKLVDGKLVDNPDAKWAITDTTRDDIRGLVKAAEEQGQSVQQLAKAIREAAAFSSARAKRIAQWELGYSANNGNLIAWKRSGVVEAKRSILGSEHRICDECDANVKAGAIGLDELFPSGHLCAPYHPGCPCTNAPVVKSGYLK